MSTKFGSLGNVYVECEKHKLYRVGGVRYSGVSNELKSMEKQSFRIVSSILWVSTVEGCLLSGAPLYVISIKYNFSFSVIVEIK